MAQTSLISQFTKGRHTTGALCVFVLALLSPAYASQTRIPPEAIAAYEQASETDKVRNLIQLANSEQFEFAAQLLQRYPLQGPHAANRTLYIEGLILRNRGQLREATVKFRQALAADPSLTLVRADLADTLYAMGETDGAKHHLELLEAEAPNEQAALGLRSFINSIDASKPYRFSAYMMAVPTTNVNSGTSASKIYIPALDKYAQVDQASKRQSALGMAVGGSAAYIRPLTDELQAVIAAGSEVRVYDDSDYNSLGLSQSLELRYAKNSFSAGVGFVAGQGFGLDHLQLGSLSYGPRASLGYMLTPKDTVSAEALFEWNDIRHSIDEDYTQYSLDLSYTHGFNSTLNASLYGGFTKVDKVDDLMSYRILSGGASVYKELTGGITLDLGTEIRHIAFDEENLAALKYRRDWRSVTTLALTKRDFEIFGLAPAIQYTFVWNNSNIPIYDFTSHSVDFRLTHEF